MFSKVVVGVDGFRSDRDAVAAARAVAPDAHLDLVTVYPDANTPLRESLDEYRELMREDTLRRLRDLREKTGTPDASVFAVADYSPSRGLKRHARESGADLIVLGASREGPVSRAFLGDFARGVLQGAPCPVLNVARSHSAAGATPRVIGVAYDSTREANEALDVAVGLAQRLGARLEIAEAVDVGVIPAIWGMQVAEYLDGLVGPEQERLEALASALPVPATARASRGQVRQVLHSLSTRVDLMVCGSRSWGAPGRIAFGSTADRLVHHSPCPVLVVPRGAAVADAATGAHLGDVEAGHRTEVEIEVGG